MENLIFNWADEKNITLKQQRGVCFEDVVTSVRDNRILDIIKNPGKKYENQYCLIIEILNYAYVVPFVKTENSLFLKTIYPSRKQTKKYLNKAG